MWLRQSAEPHLCRGVCWGFVGCAGGRKVRARASRITPTWESTPRFGRNLSSSSLAFTPIRAMLGLDGRNRLFLPCAFTPTWESTPRFGRNGCARSSRVTPIRAMLGLHGRKRPSSPRITPNWMILGSAGRYDTSPGDTSADDVPDVMTRHQTAHRSATRHQTACRIEVAWAANSGRP